MRRLMVAAATGGLVLALAPHALAQGPVVQGPVANPDPWERFNRFSFRVHQAIDRAALRPLAMAYVHVTPKPLREAIHNVIANLGEPVVAFNDVFQGRFRQAGMTTVRFATNSTVGVAGVFDVATGAGAPHHHNGFDLTLGRYHVASGPFLFIPLLGPTTVRDLIGMGVDGAINPIQWAKYPERNTVVITRAIVGGVDLRARVDSQLESLMSDAVDPYATLRSVYLQNVQSQINEGQPDAAPQPLPDFDEAAPAPAPGASATAAPASPAPTSPAPGASGAEAAPAEGTASPAAPQGAPSPVVDSLTITVLALDAPIQGL